MMNNPPALPSSTRANTIELGYFIEGVTIPFYFIDYISD